MYDFIKKIVFMTVYYVKIVIVYKFISNYS